jgi:hypothetical protein
MLGGGSQYSNQFTSKEMRMNTRGDNNNLNQNTNYSNSIFKNQGWRQKQDLSPS